MLGLAGENPKNHTRLHMSLKCLAAVGVGGTCGRGTIWFYPICLTESLESHEIFMLEN